jgi:hypothetical protein
VCRVMCRGSSEALLLLELSCSCSAPVAARIRALEPQPGRSFSTSEGCEERPAARGVRTQKDSISSPLRPVRFIPGCCKFIGKLGVESPPKYTRACVRASWLFTLFRLLASVRGTCRRYGTYLTTFDHEA